MTENTPTVRGAARVLSKARLRLARMGIVRGSFDEHLVWIFGSPRSGSTWLLQLLAEHPSVVPVNEPLIGLYLGPFLSDLGADPGELDLANFTMARLNQDNISNVVSNAFRDVWAPALGRLLRARFYAHAVRFPSRAPLAGTLVVLKEPNGSQAADLVMASQPRARLLFLLRDGRDVVDSTLAVRLEDAWVTKAFPGMRGVESHERLQLVTDSAHKWLWQTEVVQHAFAAHRGDKYMVRYEDLLLDPFAEMRSMFQWLQLDVPADELREWIHRRSFEQVPSELRGPNKFARSASPGSWRENLTAEENAAVAGIIGPKLRELGYDL